MSLGLRFPAAVASDTLHAMPGSTLGPLGASFAAPGVLGPPSPMLADNIDPVTKDLRDLFVGADPVDDQVQVTVMTTLGSGGSVLGTGLRVNSRKITSDLEDVLTGDVRQAFKTMVANRDIEFRRITYGTDPTQTGNPTGEADEANQSAQVNIEYVNLRAFDFRARTLPLVSRPQRTVV